MSADLNLKNLAGGMTDAELELACEAQSTGSSPWANWSAEIYSFGKCLRFWTKYPAFFPLYVYSDHGVGLHTHLYPHELENQYKVHFTWHPMKEQRHKDLAAKKVLRITHPWISYRFLQGIKRSTHPKGTLAFFAHHVPATKFHGHDNDEYFSKLRALPEKFQPVVLCLHMHDIKASHHKELRRHGFPIVTAGNTLSVNFVDRFYNIVKDYSYATSNIWGSQVAYCVEFGLPYFLLGERPKLINISHKEMPLGEVVHQDKYVEEYEKRANELFRSPVDAVSPEQRTFVELLLGVDSKITPKQVSWILWREFFRQWRQWPVFLKPMVFKPILILRSLLIAFFRKIGCLELIKKILRHSKGGRI